jgi:hypothetical protein
VERVIEPRSTCSQLYLLARPLLRPPNTPPWPTTLVYALLWTLSVVHLCVAFYVRASLGRFPPWATPVWFTLETGNIVVTSILLLVIGGLPLASPYVLVRLVSQSLVVLSTWLSSPSSPLALTPSHHAAHHRS